ncbi:Methylmalonyl-CoA carboxyltransferase 12S subunit [Achromobacter veterisilvae]|uniref:Methylmalonyl-CoA carboxyltransferase 12S subunit n=1 Tax=Achromobacter veterisilvae TaxID=2069367 RepID=A0A446CSV4_9BURK|nr:carboxyl transferase domain-containing protein [Achromobacter veterisilvae]SSW70939.1 Methylmalonyl-CoA carboxyltransferase 12S subunit [Achromobacter veterisilvae]
MAILSSRLGSGSPKFVANAAAYDELRAPLLAARERAVAGGGERARQVHLARGKLLPRERVNILLDPGTPFLEIGQLAADGAYEGQSPGAGIITGVGIVAGRACMIMANDATVKGGTYYPLTIKKQLRAQAIARENGLPCVYMVDSGGAYLPLQGDLFPDEQHFGKIFRNIAEMSAVGLKQVAAVLGACTAGGAYIPAMCDETVIVDNAGMIYLGGPQLVQAATGEVVDAQDLGGADTHTRLSGVADHFANDELHALELVRGILGRCGAAALAPPPGPCRPPRFDVAELPGLIPANPKQAIPMRDVLARLMDGSELVQYRERYGSSLICGTGSIGGYPVGVLANDGVLFGQSAQKAANFIELCCQVDIPLVFLHNISGFMVGVQYEQGGIAKDGAKMINAVSTARVPKFSVIVGGSYGAGAYAMCGRAFGPRLMAMWPNARTSVMGGEQAATVLALVRADQLARQGKDFSAEEAEAFKAPIRDTYGAESTALNAASHLWVDSVIEPADTRDWLTLGLALAAGGPKEPTRFGVFRM